MLKLLQRREIGQYALLLGETMTVAQQSLHALGVCSAHMYSGVRNLCICTRSPANKVFTSPGIQATHALFSAKAHSLNFSDAVCTC
jgi:hypothetical protein